MRLHLCLVTFAATLLWPVAFVFAGNLLANSSFEIAGPNGPQTVFTGYLGGGPSAAQNWNVWHNTPNSTTTTQLVTSSFPGPGGGLWNLHVTTNGAANGIAQVYLPVNTGPGCTDISAWVYVFEGQVYIGAGNEGNTGNDVASTTTGQWELLQAGNGVCPANTFIVYSAVADGADFLVELASVVDFACASNPADIDDDGIVDVDDLLAVIAGWGECSACPADVTGDNGVNVDDLLAVINAWGTCA